MLTDTAIRKAAPTAKPYKMADGGGLHLFVSPAGGKLWRYRYEIGGKEKTLSIGKYPAISLAAARQARDKARSILAAGRDPSIAKRVEKLTIRAQAADNFEAIAREWFEANEARWTKVHSDDVLESLERDVFPFIGTLPVVEIEPPQILTVVRQIEQRGAIETGGRVRQRMSAVFVYAIATGRAKTDPAAIIKGALAFRRKGRFPAITDLEKARQIIRDVDATPGFAITKLAIRLVALTAVRPGVIPSTPWSELPQGADLWVIPAARMKMSAERKEDEARDHIVPLSRQAVETIETIRTITGKGPLVFPNTRHAHKGMSSNAMGYMLNRAGYHSRHVPHGWRSTFSTIMNERNIADAPVIDFMLAHQPENTTEAAYNRALYLPRRIELAQIWADLITDGLDQPSSVIGMPVRTLSKGRPSTR